MLKITIFFSDCVLRGGLWGRQGWAVAHPWLSLTVFCPPLSSHFSMYKIGENQPGVGSWHQIGWFCPPQAYAEREPLFVYTFFLEASPSHQRCGVRSFHAQQFHFRGKRLDPHPHFNDFRKYSLFFPLSLEPCTLTSTYVS